MSRVKYTTMLAQAFAYIATHPNEHVHIAAQKEEDAIRLAEVMSEVINRLHIELVSTSGGPNPAVQMGGVLNDQKLVIPGDHEQVMHPEGVNDRAKPAPQIIVPKGIPSGEEVQS